MGGDTINLDVGLREGNELGHGLPYHQVLNLIPLFSTLYRPVSDGSSDMGGGRECHILCIVGGPCRPLWQTFPRGTGWPLGCTW